MQENARGCLHNLSLLRFASHYTNSCSVVQWETVRIASSRAVPHRRGVSTKNMVFAHQAGQPCEENKDEKSALCKDSQSHKLRRARHCLEEIRRACFQSLSGMHTPSGGLPDLSASCGSAAAPARALLVSYADPQNLKSAKILPAETSGRKNMKIFQRRSVGV